MTLVRLHFGASHLVIAGFFLILLTACSRDTDPLSAPVIPADPDPGDPIVVIPALSPEELEQLHRGEERWRMRGGASYRYEVELDIPGCAPLVAVVMVRNDSVVPQPAGIPPVKPPDCARTIEGRTVEGWFRLIREYQHALSASYDPLKVEFDSTLGYPSLVDMRLGSLQKFRISGVELDSP